MRRAPWTLLSSALLLGLLVAALWVLPPAFDWNRYRDEIAARASEVLGRRVTIGGRVTLALFPAPVFTAALVSVAPNEGGAGEMTAAELRVGVTFESLVSGRVEAREVVLRGAELKLPWPPPADALVFRPPPWLAALSARVERATVTIGAVVLRDVEATLSTADGTGTYVGAGTASLSGRTWKFAVQLSRPGPDGAAGLSLALDGQGAAAGIGVRLSGQVDAQGAFAGRVSCWGGDLSTLLPGPPLPFRAEGRATIASGLAVADELVGDVGGAPMKGAIALRISPQTRLDLALTASRLDLDAWWTALLRHGDADALPGFPLGIDLSGEVAQFAGGTLRGIRAAFDIAGGTVDLRELRATLPGEAALRAAGRLTLPAPKRPTPTKGRFDGHVALTALTPRTTLGWALGRDPAAFFPEGVLRQVDLAAHIVAGDGELALDGLAGAVDGTTLAGTLALHQGARLALAAGLKFGRIDADPFLPAHWPGLAGLLPALGTLDADLRLEAEHVEAAGYAGEAVVLDALLAAGKLELRRFEGVLGGVRLGATGTLGEGGRLSDARFTLAAAASALRGPAFTAFWPEWLLRAVPAEASIWRAPVEIEVQTSGVPTALGLKLLGSIGDLRVEFTPSADLAAARWSGSLTLRHPGAPRLAESLGLAGTPAWLGDGSFGLVTQLSGDAGRIAASSFDLAAGSLRAAGSLVLASTATGHGVTGRIRMETLPLPLPYWRSGETLPGIDLAGWEAAVRLEADEVQLGGLTALRDGGADLTLSAGVLRLGGLTGKLAGGNVAADIRVDTLADPPPVTVSLALKGMEVAGALFDLPFDLSLGVYDLTASLTASGHSPRALLATLAGEVKVAGRSGMLEGVALGQLGGAMADADLRAGLAGGSTSFERADLLLGVEHGVLGLRRAEVVAPTGTIAASGLIDLNSGSQDLRLDLRPAVAAPPHIGLDLRGPLASPTRTPDLADIIRWRAANPP